MEGLLKVSNCLTLLLLNTTCPVVANSIDPDQLASEEATDLDLHCLLLSTVDSRYLDLAYLE